MGTSRNSAVRSIDPERNSLKRSFPTVFVAVLIVLVVAMAASAAAPEDRVLPPSQYLSPKAKELATRHAKSLYELSADVYHCLPWLDVRKDSIGFFKPKNAATDDRYLSMRVFIDQRSSPEFDQQSLEQQASAMFSRYVGPLLKRMTRNPAILADDAIYGFNVILEWTKQAPESPRARPVNETIAAFMDKADAIDYLSGKSGAHELAEKARVLAWDGEREIGRIQLSAWDDNFVATYKVQNYQVKPGVTCP